jgi:hypothetical protein
MKNKEIMDQIGKLIYEQQLYMVAGNDDQCELLEIKIDKLRSKLIPVEPQEVSEEN